MRLIYSICLCLLALGCRRDAPPDQQALRSQPDSKRGIFGAYYYPWYDNVRWRDQAVTHTPKLGKYQSSDRKTAEQHIAWAKQADLDFFMVSWIAPGRMEDDNLKKALVPELEKARFHFALLYETPLALGIPAGLQLDLARTMPNTGTKTGNLMIEHFDYLATTYFTRESYLRIEGKPVVMFYVVRDMTNAAPFFKMLRERMQKRGITLHLIADVLYWNEPEKFDCPFLRENFQALTGYNMYMPLQGGKTNFIGLVQAQIRATERTALPHGLKILPTVMPGYDDTALRGSGRPSLPRSDGTFYRDYWDMAQASVVPGQPLLLINSFNEWHEGTEIEPSQEFGDTYLSLTRELIARTRAQLNPTNPP